MTGHIEVGVDWFQGTFPPAMLPAILAVVSLWFDPFGRCERPMRFRGLEHSIQWEPGALVAWDPTESWAFVRLPGACVDALNQYGMLAVVIELLKVGVKPTRIDTYRDDYSKELMPDDLFVWANEGKLRRYKKHGYFNSGTLEDRGTTFTAGERGDSGSGLFVRFYDKSKDKKDFAPCVRLECEFSGGKAEEVGRLLLSVAGEGLEPVAELLNSLCIGSLDFSEESKLQRLDRSKRLSRWASYCENKVGLRVSAPKRTSKLRTAIDALCNQYGGLLANLSSAGIGVLLGVIKGAVHAASTKGYRSNSNRGEGRECPSVKFSRGTGEWTEVISILRQRSNNIAPLEKYFQTLLPV